MYLELSYPINQNMPTYPGSPQFEVSPLKRMKKGDYANTSLIRIYTHAGTHVDAPFHFYNKGKTIDQIPINDFGFTLNFLSLYLFSKFSFLVL